MVANDGPVPVRTLARPCLSSFRGLLGKRVNISGCLGGPSGFVQKPQISKPVEVAQAFDAGHTAHPDLARPSTTAQGPENAPLPDQRRGMQHDFGAAGGSWRQPRKTDGGIKSLAR